MLWVWYIISHDSQPCNDTGRLGKSGVHGRLAHAYVYIFLKVYETQYEILDRLQVYYRSMVKIKWKIYFESALTVVFVDVGPCQSATRVTVSSSPEKHNQPHNWLIVAKSQAEETVEKGH